MSNKIMHFINYNLATGCGVGLSPYAPGTMGSLIAVLLAWLFFPHPWYFQLTLVFAVSVIAIFSADWMAEALDDKDPSMVIIDEIAGQLLVFMFLPQPMGWKGLLLGFVLFRIFDIWKPWPVRRAEKLPGGTGIVLDDLVAGVYAGILANIGLRYL